MAVHSLCVQPSYDLFLEHSHRPKGNPICVKQSFPVPHSSGPWKMYISPLHLGDGAVLIIKSILWGVPWLPSG